MKKFVIALMAVSAMGMTAFAADSQDGAAVSSIDSQTTALSTDNLVEPGHGGGGGGFGGGGFHGAPGGGGGGGFHGAPGGGFGGGGFHGVPGGGVPGGGFHGVPGGGFGGGGFHGVPGGGVPGGGFHGVPGGGFHGVPGGGFHGGYPGRVFNPYPIHGGYYPWPRWGFPWFARPVYDWSWNSLVTVTCTAVDSNGNQYPVTEDGYTGDAYEGVLTQVEDAAMNRCYAESNGDQGCQFEGCTPGY